MVGTIRLVSEVGTMTATLEVVQVVEAEAMVEIVVGTTTTVLDSAVTLEETVYSLEVKTTILEDVGYSLEEVTSIALVLVDSTHSLVLVLLTTTTVVELYSGAEAVTPRRTGALLSSL